MGKKTKECDCEMNIKSTYVWGFLTVIILWGSFYLATFFSWTDLDWYHIPYMLTSLTIFIVCTVKLCIAVDEAENKQK